MRETEKIMEYARLCGASYKAPSEMENFLSSDAAGGKYGLVSYRDAKASGFQCYLLKDLSDGGYVFAFRGTEFIREPVKDTILTDARMMLFGPPPQMYDALAFAAEMQKKYGFSDKEAVCTGHSLGGTLAAMTGYVFGFEAYAFNPYGIGKLTGSADCCAGRSGGNIAGYMKKLGVTVKKNRETIHSFLFSIYSSSALNARLTIVHSVSASDDPHPRPSAESLRGVRGFVTKLNQHISRLCLYRT